MKSKKVIVGLVLLNFIFVSSLISSAKSDNPKQANGDYSLGFGIGDEFEFICTVFDTTELSNVFGGDWQSNVGSYFWFTGFAPPTDLGQKAKFAIANITEHGSLVDWWWFILDGWSFIAESASYGAPVVNDAPYSWPENVTGSVYWNPTVWIVSLPVVQCLSVMSYGTGLTIYENVVILSDSDVDNFFIFWIYDENTGIVETFRIRNDSATIFELNSPVSAPSNEIPGYSIYILISTIVLLISFISIILIKKVKWN